MRCRRTGWTNPYRVLHALRSEPCAVVIGHSLHTTDSQAPAWEAKRPQTQVRQTKDLRRRPRRFTPAFAPAKRKTCTATRPTATGLPGTTGTPKCRTTCWKHWLRSFGNCRRLIGQSSPPCLIQDTPTIDRAAEGCKSGLSRCLLQQDRASVGIGTLASAHVAGGCRDLRTGDTVCQFARRCNCFV
jgi:hypothetical protein